MDNHITLVDGLTKMLQYTHFKIQQYSKDLSKNLLRSFAILTLFITAVGCENSISEIQQLSQNLDNLPASTSIDVSMQFSDSGKVQIRLIAPVLERYSASKSPYNLLPKGVEIQFIDSFGNLEATVISNYGIHYPDKNIVDLSDDVRVIHINGDLLNSEHLIWNAKTQKISSDDFVKITTADEIMYGDGFEANQDFTDYRINNIKGIISIEDETL